MKHGRNPTRKQKMFIKECRLNPENWLVVKDCCEYFEIVYRLTGNRKRLKDKNTRSAKNE